MGWSECDGCMMGFLQHVSDIQWCDSGSANKLFCKCFIL